MSKLALKGLKVVVPIPKKRRNTSIYIKESNKLIQGTVIEDEVGNFKIAIKVNDIGTKEILDFTPNSFDLKDRTSIFTKKKDTNGRRVRYIRSASDAHFFPHSSDHYIPFNVNWIVKGYIVKQGLIKLFDFVDLVGIEGYNNYIPKE